MSDRSQILPSDDVSALTGDLAPLQSLMEPNVAPQQVGAVLAEIFHVQPTEVALLRLESGALRFLFPDQLRTAGTIPVSSTTVAAHTAASKKSEIFNNFARVKHASIFESIRLDGESLDQPEPAPIQKLMSAPVMDEDSRVLGVVQVSRKGLDPSYAGADFSREDLHELELAATVLASSNFMQTS